MINKIHSELNKIDDLKSLNIFIDSLEANDIGIWGGRKFIDKNRTTKGELALNDIVRRFDELSENIKVNPSDALEIRRKIYELDDAANEKLSHKNLFTRIMTQLRSWIGPAPKITLIGMEYHWSRSQVLQSLAQELKNGEKTQYLIEELFDEVSHSIKNDKNNKQIRKIRDQITSYLRNPSNTAAVDVINSFRDLFNTEGQDYEIDDPVSLKHHLSSHFFENRPLLTDLIYLGYTQQNTKDDSFIKDKFLPLLMLAYAYVSQDVNVKIQGTKPENPPPIPNLTYMNTYLEDWSLYEDQKLCDAASKLAHILKI